MKSDLKWFFSRSSLVPFYAMKICTFYCDIHILMFNAVNMKNISKVLLVIKPASEADLLSMDTNDRGGFRKASMHAPQNF